MKFLTPISNDDVSSIMDVMAMSMLYYNDIKHKHIKDDPSIIDDLAQSVVSLAAHNVNIKKVKDLAVMQIDESELVKKVERNGRVLGVIKGGRAE